MKPELDVLKDSAFLEFPNGKGCCSIYHKASDDVVKPQSKTCPIALRLVRLTYKFLYLLEITSPHSQEMNLLK